LKTIGIIGAMDEEIAFIKEIAEIISAKNILGLDFYITKFGGNSVIIVKCGIGKVNAAACTQVLIDHFAVDCVINLGVAGAIYKELNIGDIVVSSDAIQHDMDVSALGDPVGTIPRMAESRFKADSELIEKAVEAGSALEGHKVFTGTIASGDQFIASAEAKNRIWDNFKAYCAEMEGAAIAHVCYLNKMPFVIIRSISDKADEQADMSFEEFTKIAVKNSSVILEGMLNNI
jgi:adenosylhomocysteine nucleosidase